MIWVLILLYNGNAMIALPGYFDSVKLCQEAGEADAGGAAEAGASHRGPD